MYKITTNNQHIEYLPDYVPNSPGHQTAVTGVSKSIAIGIVSLCEFSEAITVEAIQEAYNEIN